MMNRPSLDRSSEFCADAVKVGSDEPTLGQSRVEASPHFITTPPRPAKRVAVLQSNYIPWKGYFDILRSVDEFILYDDVQYTKNDWRNRNRIKTANGVVWLTIPVRQTALHQEIRETRVVDQHWRKKHWETIAQSYARAPHFAEYRDGLKALYLETDDELLSDINARFLTSVARWLGIDVRLRRSDEFSLVEGRNERLVDLCRQAGATEYLSGPAAKDYLDEDQFTEAGITVRWVDYRGYPEYRQRFPPFVHDVSAVDLLLNEGPRANEFCRRF